MTQTESKIIELQKQGFTAFQIAEELNLQVVSVTNRISELKRGNMKEEQRRAMMPRRSVVYDIEAANAFRAMPGIDLAPVRTGERECLCCERVFMSDDLKNQKMCVVCRRAEDVCA